VIGLFLLDRSSRFADGSDVGLFSRDTEEERTAVVASVVLT